MRVPWSGATCSFNPCKFNTICSAEADIKPSLFSHSMVLNVSNLCLLPSAVGMAIGSCTRLRHRYRAGHFRGVSGMRWLQRHFTST